MFTISRILTLFIGLEHFFFLYLEMFLWTTPTGRKTFGTTPEFATASKTLAANQGLYNGFLAAGLLWSVIHPDPAIGRQVQLFFLICVVIAGVYGGVTVKRSILFVQAVPALIALIATVIA
jgi:putative membrane protein